MPCASAWQASRRIRRLADMYDLVTDSALLPGFDEVVEEDALDFGESGLRVPSVIRVGRLAVVEGEILAGAIGQIAPERLHRIKSRLAEWLAGP